MPDNSLRETDFLKTLQRMYRCSRILFEKREYYTCCYLCGYILECGLKYILLKFGRDENGDLYSTEKLKSKFKHGTQGLNNQLESYIASTEGIASRYRLDCRRKTPYMLEGREGYSAWNPKYRYGEHPKWDDREFCQHYMEESQYIFDFITEIEV